MPHDITVDQDSNCGSPMAAGSRLQSAGMRQRSNGSSVRSMKANGEEEGKPFGQIEVEAALEENGGTHKQSKPKADLLNTRGSFQSAGGTDRKGQSSDGRAVSLLGQGTSTLHAMQNPHRNAKFGNSLISCSDSKPYGAGGKTAVASNDRLGGLNPNGGNQRHANSNSMTKKMFSQMGSNIIQGEGCTTNSVGSNSAIRNKPTSHSGMGNVQGPQDFLMPSMVKKENNFMVGSGTQLNSKTGTAEQPVPALSLFNSDTKKNTRGSSHQGAAAPSAFKAVAMTEAQSCNEDKPPARGDKQRIPSQIGTPNNASRFAQNGPVKATTVMLQGVASVTDSTAVAQGKPGMTSPFVVEKKVADIAGILQMRAPMKDAQQSQAAMKNRQPPGTFFTTQAAGKVAATTSTFYAPKCGSQ